MAATKIQIKRVKTEEAKTLTSMVMEMKMRTNPQGKRAASGVQINSRTWQLIKKKILKKNKIEIQNSGYNAFAHF